MEFWLDNQGQSQMYPRFGTLPGRNCANSYHERRQATYNNTLCYGEQQDQGRECSDWMVPGSRVGGALQEYTSWTNPEPPDSSSPNFPFILHRHEQRHQDLGDYRQHNPRNREWASHAAARDYDRGLLRDALPKRWDQSQPVRHNRDVSAKRNDSSYRELEAWAARYSHSLPRRRRLEAELREAVQGQSEREKLLTHPEVQLQCNQLNRSSRAHGLWDKAGPLTTDLNHMKGNTEYQSRVPDKPPGYIGPPSYNRPHKSPPVMHHCDFGRQLVEKKQGDWSQPTLRKSDVLLDLETKSKVKKDVSKICPGLEELEFSKHERDALQGIGSIDTQKPEGVLDEEPQAVQKSDTEKEEICKVIEGRKFRLKKKTGGMTIFCLVSRIASPSETTSSPVSSIQSTEIGELSKDKQIGSQVNKIADDVDFRAHTLTEQSDKKSPKCREKVMPKDNLPNNVFLENSGVVPQPVEPVLIRYPLWREPSSSTKPETENLNTNCLKETRSILNQDQGADVRSQSTDFEKDKVDIAGNSEDMDGLLVIDTSCVVVKVEMIPSPKKEQVHYLDSTPHDEGRTSESNAQVYQDIATDPSNESLQKYEDPGADLDPTLLKKQEEKEIDNSLSVVQSSLVSERETLEERAERILGIPLHDDEQQTDDEEPLIDLCKEEQSEEAEPPDSGQTLEDTAEVLLVDKVEKDDNRKLPTSEDSKDFTASQQPANNMTEDDNTEPQLETINTSTKNELKKERGGEFTCGESENEGHLVDVSNTYSLSSDSSDSSTQEGAESELDAQSVDPTPHSDASPPLFPESPDSSSTPSEEHLPSPPPLEVLFLEADVESGAEPKHSGDEMSDLAENGSLATEMKEVLPRLHNHQCDNTFCVTKEQTVENDSSRAEAKYEDLNISAQQLRSAQTEGATYVNKDEELQQANSNFSDSTVQTGEDNEENPRTCESEDYSFLSKYDLKDNVLSKIEKDVTQEPSQRNPDLTASPLKETTSNDGEEFTQTHINTLQNSQDECLDNTCPSSGEVLNKFVISDISSSPQESDRECAPLSETDSTGCPLSNDITAARDVVGNASNSFYLDSSEESSQLTIFLSQEEDVSPKISPTSAQKRASQYPKSLLDVVSRIRKHTAPDSESEEEEVSEQWDLSCLDVVADTKSERNSNELQAVLELNTGQTDKGPEGHLEEDKMSCSSHVSEGIITLGTEETTLSGEVKEEYDAGEQELRCSSEGKDETQLEESEELEDNINICGSSEESPVEVDQEVSDVLS